MAEIDLHGIHGCYIVSKCSVSLSKSSFLSHNVCAVGLQKKNTMLRYSFYSTSSENRSRQRFGEKLRAKFMTSSENVARERKIGGKKK